MWREGTWKRWPENQRLQLPVASVLSFVVENGGERGRREQKQARSLKHLCNELLGRRKGGGEKAELRELRVGGKNVKVCRM